MLKKLLIKLNYILILFDIYIFYNADYTIILSAKIGDFSFLSILYLIYLFIRYKIIFKSLLDTEKLGKKQSLTIEEKRLERYKNIDKKTEEQVLLKPSAKKSSESFETKTKEKSRFDIAKSSELEMSKKDNDNKEYETKNEIEEDVREEDVREEDVREENEQSDDDNDDNSNPYGDEEKREDSLSDV